MPHEKIPYFSFAAMHAEMGDTPYAVFKQFWDKQWYILGESLAAFEREFAEWSGVRHCIGVGNCFDSLYLSLLALEPKAGDEIILPANAPVQTWLAVIRAGATPKPVDVEWQTHNLDAALVEAAVSARTKGIIPVHANGRACDMTRLMAIAEKHGLFILEDNGQSIGAAHRGQKTGSFGRINGVSFYPTKILGAAGDAGAVTTDNDELAAKVRKLRNYGAGKKNDHELLGANSRMDEIQAALLSAKLPFLDRWIAERRKLAALYLEILNGAEGLFLPVVDDPQSHSWLSFVLCSKQRDAIAERLAAENIGCMIQGRTPVYLQQAYRGLGFRSGDFPVTERIAGSCLNLPIFPGLTEAQVERVCAAVKK